MIRQRSRWSFRGKLFPVYMFIIGFGGSQLLIYLSKVIP